MENSSSESGIFNSYLMQKINRECKPCIFSQRLSRNLIKYLFDFFYYRELYQMCSANLFLYQCFTEYQLLTWKLEMNNIIDIFHLNINKYDEEVDNTLMESIKKKRTYSMKDHPGCYVRINKEGINIISLAYYDHSVQGDYINSNNFSQNKIYNNNINIINNDQFSPFKNNNNNIINNKINTQFSPDENNNDKNNYPFFKIKFNIDNSNNLNNINTINSENNINTINENDILSQTGTIESTSEIMSNFGSIESINFKTKANDSNIWEYKLVENSYIKNKCIILNKTTPLNFGFSFYHVIKGDYQLYLHHSLINMKNARLILQVSINGINVYTLEDFPPNELYEQDKREEKEKEKNIKLNEYFICNITKKMFDECSFNINNLEENLIEEETNKIRDYEIRVSFKNQDLFWKAGWCVDGGRLLRKIYEVNENSYKNFKRFKSENINIFGSIKKINDDNSNENEMDIDEYSSLSLNKLRNRKRNTIDFIKK